MPIRIRATVFVALAMLLAACSEMLSDTGTISQRIGEVVHSPGETEVDLSKLTSFGWEYFYASKPGITREEVCSFIRAGRNVCGRIVRIEKAPADHVYLIFGLKGKLTHIELHALANGQFDMQFPEEGFPRGKAIFKVRRSFSGSGKDSILLEPK